MERNKTEKKRYRMKDSQRKREMEGYIDMEKERWREIRHRKREKR